MISSFYENDTVKNDRSRKQIRERHKTMKRSAVGKAKLKEGREDVAAAKALVKLASGSS